jgi:hypothetical protein
MGRRDWEPEVAEFSHWLSLLCYTPGHTNLRNESARIRPMIKGKGHAVQCWA